MEKLYIKDKKTFLKFKFLDLFFKNKNPKLLTWVKFLINPESLGVGEMDEIKEAKEELEKIRLDEIESWRAEMRQKFIADEKVRRMSALEDGIEQGIELGEKNKQIEIAKRMLIKKEKIDYIVEITDLSKEEVKEIDKELKESHNKKNNLLNK